MNDASTPSLSEAVHATQRVQLAIDLAKLKARQAQVVQAKRVWADGRAPGSYSTIGCRIGK